MFKLADLRELVFALVFVANARRSAGEAIQDTRGAADRTSVAVLSPVSLLQSTTTTAEVKAHQQGDMNFSSELEGSAHESSNGLPKSFAWPNPFTDPSFEEHSTNQGACGSCYAIAAVYALERRIDIGASKLLGHNVSVFSGVEVPTQHSAFLDKASVRLSPQSIVSCSFYNQGCHGGFPYLVGKHATEIGNAVHRNH